MQHRPAVRYLILSNLYPPHWIGGYELGCRDLVEQLRARGALVQVLTSRYRKGGIAGIVREEGVSRSLYFMFEERRHTRLFPMARQVRHDTSILDELLQAFGPDVVLVFNTWGLQKAVLAELDCYSIPVVHLLSDYSLPAGLKVDPWFMFWIHRPQNYLKRITKDFLSKWLRRGGWGLPPADPICLVTNAVYTSRAVQRSYHEACIRPQSEAVIHWGVNSEEIVPRSEDRPFQGKILFVGQFREDKGPHTAVEAIKLISDQGFFTVTLDLIGGTQIPDYVSKLKAMIAEYRLAGMINLVGEIPRNELVRRYAQYDVLVFPSIWAEPFSITLLEAMAAGLGIISTPTGGSCELLRDGENALLFAPSDAGGLCRCLRRWIENPGEWKRIREQGRKEIRGRFTMRNMTEELLTFLNKVATPKS